MNVEQLDTTKRTTLSAARGVAKLLLPTEDTTDLSIVAGCQLLQQLAKSRVEVGLSVSMGHEAMQSAMDGIAALVEARGKFMQCHQELAAVRDKLSLRSEDVGCTYNSMPSAASAITRKAS